MEENAECDFELRELISSSSSSVEKYLSELFVNKYMKVNYLN